MPIYAIKQHSFTPDKPLIRYSFDSSNKILGEVRGDIEGIVLYGIDSDCPFPVYSEHLPVQETAELVKYLKNYDPNLPCIDCFCTIDQFNTDTVPFQEYRDISSVMSYPSWYDGSRKWYTVENGVITTLNRDRGGRKIIIEGLRGPTLSHLADMSAGELTFIDVSDEAKGKTLESYQYYIDMYRHL